ncbi:NAD(P)/FAD-dependent oxidoreductase [Undibacterium rugosum]|uniref:NAD(P)/FAD-dependent oxidoreductase n=1 Tax=Undibacterium rugosum TaxID=2762291 RepID=UPI001B82CEF4|nr:FAD-dependent oxidoreductase [Undibacterium rugosum]MBR7778779.1 FAD-dependent oxidoreductase [Undibacterium rugosum]
MHIAVVGAGLSGLTAARHLQMQGHHVTVYEKSLGVSGRMSTRHTELGGFDHGAQYFTATTDRFKKEVADWKKVGWVQPWDARLVNLEAGVVKAAGRHSKPYVAVPGMNALGKHLAHGLDVRSDQQVLALEAYQGQWLLKIQSSTVSVAASAGPFDAVILAIPSDQAIPLLQPLPAFAAQAEQARLSPCWCLMLGFQTALDLSYDGAWVQQSRLGWIARDNAKPQHRAGERWVAHATRAWSEEHLEDEPERAKEKLLKAFHEATGSWIQPIYAVVHRWRYSQAQQPLQQTCLWDAKVGIGVCGDWFANGLEGGGKVENAFLSGLALASAVG